MGPQRGRRMRKIEVPTDTPTDFLLGYMAADIHRRREEKEAIERAEEAQEQRGIHAQQRREWPKSIQGQNKVTQNTDAGGEASTSQSHSRCGP